MYTIIWEFQIKPEKQSGFEKFYSSNGAWVELFRKSRGYIGSDLLHDEMNPFRYLTIDRWESKANYDDALSEWEMEYTALDLQCEGLTESESCIGKFQVNFP